MRVTSNFSYAKPKPGLPVFFSPIFFSRRQTRSELSEMDSLALTLSPACTGPMAKLCGFICLGEIAICHFKNLPAVYEKLSLQTWRPESSRRYASGGTFVDNSWKPSSVMTPCCSSAHSLTKGTHFAEQFFLGDSLLANLMQFFATPGPWVVRWPSCLVYLSTLNMTMSSKGTHFLNILIKRYRPKSLHHCEPFSKYITYNVFVSRWPCLTKTIRPSAQSYSLGSNFTPSPPWSDPMNASTLKVMPSTTKPSYPWDSQSLGWKRYGYSPVIPYLSCLSAHKARKS